MRDGLLHAIGESVMMRLESRVLYEEGPLVMIWVDEDGAEHLNGIVEKVNAALRDLESQRDILLETIYR